MKAQLTNIYVDMSTINDESDKTNSTKRFVFKFSEKQFAVVKIFSVSKQDIDFNEHYRSVKFWINASEEEVSSHWNTKRVTSISDYVTKEQNDMVEATIQGFFPDLAFGGKEENGKFSLDKMVDLGKD